MITDSISHKYQKDPQTQAEIARLSKMTKNELLRCIRMQNHKEAGYPQTEALVYLYRQNLRNKDTCNSKEYHEALGYAIYQRIIRYLTKQSKYISPKNHEHEEMIEDIIMESLKAISSLESSDEFWEVRFYVCLKRIISRQIRNQNFLSFHEIDESSLVHNPENDADFFDTFKNQQVSTEKKALFNIVFNTLDKHSQLVIELYHRQGYNEMDIARMCNVSDRTVRNWLAKASNEFTKRWIENK
jgi:RNA polymerase sigma factor (sigma-70 family)